MKKPFLIIKLLSSLDILIAQNQSDFKTEVINGQLIITGYIGPRAFDTNQFSRIIIPDSVISIGYEAFANNKQMPSVIIGKNVFINCPKLLKVNAAKQPFKGAFKDCPNFQ
jgi:hypothetical protein